MIMEIAEKSFHDELRRSFDNKNLADVMRDTDRADSMIILAAPDKTAGKGTFGSIRIGDLVANIRSGSKSMEIQARDGKVSLDTCDAVLQIMQMYMDPATMELLRKEWRESIGDPVKKPGSPVDRLGFGGMVRKSDNIKHKGSS